MKLIHTNEGSHYRRWVNLVPSFFLPGSAQFLSGRRAAGVIMFVLYSVLLAGLIAFLLHPKSAHTVLDRGVMDLVLLPFWLLIMGDGLRRPIPRIGLRGWALFFVVSVVIPIGLVLALVAFLVRLFEVPTGGMQPTILGNRKAADGRPILCDHILVNEFTYRLHPLQRGDVIVFRTKGLPGIKDNSCYVKRLVGLPGETIGIEPPYLLVNGTKVMEPAVFRHIAEAKDGFAGFQLPKPAAGFPVTLTSPTATLTLGPDEYFVIGDNTVNSLDSRYYGPIKRSAIVGKAFYIYAPASRKGWIE